MNERLSSIKLTAVCDENYTALIFNQSQNVYLSSNNMDIFSAFSITAQFQ